jgi:hypothetical protein
MDGTAVKQIAEMQSDIENYKSDLIALLTLVTNPESANFLQYSNQTSLEIADEIVKLQSK